MRRKSTVMIKWHNHNSQRSTRIRCQHSLDLLSDRVAYSIFDMFEILMNGKFIKLNYSKLIKFSIFMLCFCFVQLEAFDCFGAVRRTCCLDFSMFFPCFLSRAFFLLSFGVFFCQILKQIDLILNWICAWGGGVCGSGGTRVCSGWVDRLTRA